MGDLRRDDAERLHAADRAPQDASPARRAPRRSSTNWDEYLPKFRKVMPVEYRRRWSSWKGTGRAASGSGVTGRIMGKITGFLEIDKRDRKYAPAADRLQHYNEFSSRSATPGTQGAGGALHGLRHALLSHRLPGEQPDPRLERPRLQGRLAEGAQEPSLDQQFPRVHRPRLPCPVRGELHAQHHRPAGDHQDDRMRHRRQGLGGRLDRARRRRTRRPARRSP